MKKIYLLGISALLATTSFAQTAKRMKSVTTAETNATVNAKSAVKYTKNGVTTVVNGRGINTPNQTMSTFWSDDFSNGSNWTMTEDAGATSWTIGTTPGQGTYAIGAINSTTAANGYAIFDSDNGCDGDQIAHMTNTTPINCTGHTNIVLGFQEYYRRWYDSTYIYVSNDNTNWTRFDIHSTYVDDDITPNPNNFTIDISSVAGNQATVWVRFTFYSPSAVFGANAGCGYNWLIDDVYLKDIPAVDLSVYDGLLLNTQNNSACFLTNDNLALFAINTGMNAITVGTPGDSVTYVVNGMPMTVVPIITDMNASPVVTINPGDTVALIIATPIDLSTAGMTYNIDANISFAGSGDGDASNDTMMPIMIKNVATTPLTSANYVNGFENFDDLAGVHFLGTGGQYFTGVSQLAAGIHSGTQAIFTTVTNGTVPDSTYGALIALQCTDVVANETYRITYWRKTTGTSSAFNGQSAAFVGTDPTDSTTFMMISSAWSANTNNQWKQDSADYTPTSSGTVYFGLGGQGTTTGGLSVNCRFDDVNIFKVPSVGIKENSAVEAVAVFPNPSNGTFTVRAIEAGSVEVYSVLGENVYTSKVTKGNNTVDLSTVAAGTYVVKVKGDNQTITKRIVINK